LCSGYFGDIEVHSTVDRFGRGALDEEIIPALGAEGSILITKDFNIARTRLQNKLRMEHGLGAFFIKLPKADERHWEIVKLLVNHWEDIVKKSIETERPFGFIVHTKGKFQPM
jgi:hypothetical protein